MGRHAAPPPGRPEPRPEPPPSARPAPRSSARLTASQRLVLAGAAGATAAAVTAWGGTAWPTALALGAGAGVVVALGAWLAATLPERHDAAAPPVGPPGVHGGPRAAAPPAPGASPPPGTRGDDAVQ